VCATFFNSLLNIFGTEQFMLFYIIAELSACGMNFNKYKRKTRIAELPKDDVLQGG
jgi:hypothetical protein